MSRILSCTQSPLPLLIEEVFPSYVVIVPTNYGFDDFCSSYVIRKDENGEVMAKGTNENENINYELNILTSELKLTGTGEINTLPLEDYANLIETIMDEIRSCDIFIADISPCIMNINGEDISCDANPNVMYELGIAHNLKKPIILMREDVNFPKVPSDIQEKYRNTYKRTNTKKTQQTIQKAIEYTLEEFFV